MNEWIHEQRRRGTEEDRKEERKRRRQKKGKRWRDGGWRIGWEEKGSAPWLDLIPSAILGGWRALSIASSCLPSQQEKGFGWVLPIPQVFFIKSLTLRRTAPSLFHRMNVLFGQKRKIEVEKICYLEIQLTALIWNKCSFSPWLCCRQAGRANTVTPEAGILGGDLGTFQRSCQSGMNLESRKTVMGLISGGWIPMSSLISIMTVVSQMDQQSTILGVGKGPEEGSQGLHLPYILSTSLSVWHMEGAQNTPARKKRVTLVLRGWWETQALPLPSGCSQPNGGDKTAIKKTDMRSKSWIPSQIKII